MAKLIEKSGVWRLKYDPARRDLCCAGRVKVALAKEIAHSSLSVVV
jgi:hypothetical protein